MRREKSPFLEQSGVAVSEFSGCAVCLTCNRQLAFRYCIAKGTEVGRLDDTMPLKKDGVFGLQTRLRLKKFLSKHEKDIAAGKEKPLKGKAFGKGSVRALQRFLGQQDDLEPTKLGCTGLISPSTITVRVR